MGLIQLQPRDGCDPQRGQGGPRAGKEAHPTAQPTGLVQRRPVNRRFISTRRAGPRPRTALTQWASPPGLAQRMSKAGPAACRRGARCKHSALLNSGNYLLPTGASPFSAAAQPSTASAPAFTGNRNHRAGVTGILSWRDLCSSERLVLTPVRTGLSDVWTCHC